jgi:hypothetical protein
MMESGGIGEVAGMTVETPEGLSSDLLDLTATSLSEMRTLRCSTLDQAIRRTLTHFRHGRAGDSVQGQVEANFSSAPM